MSLPFSESANEPAVNSTEHMNSKKEAFFIGTHTRKGRLLTLGIKGICGYYTVIDRPLGVCRKSNYVAELNQGESWEHAAGRREGSGPKEPRAATNRAG